MKRLSCYFLVFTFVISCNHKTNEPFEEILNENFLNFVDTIAYKQYSFFIIPNDTNNVKNKMLADYNICVDKRLGDSKKLQDYLKQELKNSQNDNYSVMLRSEISVTVPQINLNKITLTGKFKLVDIEKCESDDRIKSIGTIRFFNPLIDGNYAIFFLSIQSSQKAGVINSFLLKKIEKKWKIERKIEIERW